LQAEKKSDGKNKKIFIPPGIVIPHAVNKSVISIRVRRGPGDYFIVPGSTVVPMIVQPGSGFEAYVVCEAHLDAAAIAADAGDLVGVIACGSTSVRPTATQHTMLQQAKCLLIAMDMDGRPGKEAADWWCAHYPAAVRWPVPDGKDPGDAYKAGVDLREWVLAGCPPRLTIAMKNEKKQNGRQEEQQQNKTKICASVQELGEIVQRYRLVLRYSETMGTEVAGGYESVPLDLYRRVEELVFLDPDVRAHLESRGELNRANYFEGLV
jgi:hypothetical protein